MRHVEQIHTRTVDMHIAKLRKKIEAHAAARSRPCAAKATASAGLSAMRRFRLLFLAFALALLAPLAFLVERALRSAALERADAPPGGRRARLRRDGARPVAACSSDEEARPVDAYAHRRRGTTPLPFVVGHFQLDPDGAMQHARADARGDDVDRAVRRRRWRVLPRAIAHAPATSRRPPAQLPGSTVGARRRGRGRSTRRRSARQAARRAEVSAFDALRSLNKGARRSAPSGRAKLAESSVAPDTAAARDEAAGRDAEAHGRAAAGRQDALRDARERRAETSAAHDAVGIVDGRTSDALPHGRARARSATGRACCSTSSGSATGCAQQGLGERRPRQRTPAVVVRRRRRRAAGRPAAGAFVYQHRFAEPSTT